jgi:nucleoside-diphosphate-sugar epimerase
MMGSRVLVTGGAGFIGSHLVDRLLRDGHDVVVLDNLSTGRRENLAEAADAVEFVEGDIRDLDAIRAAIRGADVVYHQAALPSVPRSIEAPADSHAANATGTLNVLIAAREADVRRVVYASSSSVYGDTPTLPKREEMAPSPLSPYAVSKLAGELYCRVFHHVYGLETVALRYFNVFGPRQAPDSAYAAVIPLFIQKLLDGRVPRIFGDGEQTRSFAYVADVVDANVRAAVSEGAAGRAINIAGKERISINDLDRALRDAVPAAPRGPADYGPPRPGDVRHSYADLSAAEELLGYSPRTSLAEGLRRTVEWLAER